jgi:hypothetical protein
VRPDGAPLGPTRSLRTRVRTSACPTSAPGPPTGVLRFTAVAGAVDQHCLLGCALVAVEAIRRSKARSVMSLRLGRERGRARVVGL